MCRGCVEIVLRLCRACAKPLLRKNLNIMMNRFFTFSGTQSHMGYGMLKFAITSVIGSISE